MISLTASIERIEQLLAEESASALTYACLECRLAIEYFCYDRLKSAHKYIAHDDLRRWQPSYIVTTLIEEVDEHIASTFTLSIATEPAKKQSGEMTKEDFEQYQYVPVGTQVGFDPRKIGRLWQALSSFLHVRLPRDENDRLNVFGNPTEIREKIEDVLVVLREIESGTMTSVWPRKTIRLECTCGQINERSQAALNTGKIFSCINPECEEQWRTFINDNEFEFEPVMMDVNCGECGKKHQFAHNSHFRLKRNQFAYFNCECGFKNIVRWGLVQAQSSTRPSNESA